MQWAANVVALLGVVAVETCGQGWAVRAVGLLTAVAPLLNLARLALGSHPSAVPRSRRTG